MARPAILPGNYVNILMGDGAGPEVFSPVCGARAKRLNHRVNTNDDYTRDCADPTDKPTRDIIATGELWSMPFSGVLNRTQLADMQAAVGVHKNYRFELAEPTGYHVYGGYWAGRGMLTSFDIIGDDGINCTVDGNIESDGDWVFTSVP
jgi:hypothetical protein